MRERRGKDYLSHMGIGTVRDPTWLLYDRIGIIGILWQRVGRARAGAAQVVVVERQRRVRRRVADIGLGSASTEGARESHHKCDCSKEK